MKVSLVRKVVENKIVLEFSGEFTAADLATGFPCKEPRDPINDALYKDLLSECNHADEPEPERTNEEKAFLAEILGRAARAVAVGDDAVTLDGEVIGPSDQPEGLSA